MNGRATADYVRRAVSPEAVGAVASVAVAALLFTSFGIHGTLGRDESIYTYSGQRMAHGVPPYASIFDPKGPLASLIAGVAATIARAFGTNDIYAIRIAFLVFSCLTVLATYLLAVQLWRSVTAGVVAAVVLSSFNAFAGDALSGPDAKTPGIMFAVASMWLVTRRQWRWGAFAGALAFLTWQPLVIYPLVAVVVGVVEARPGQRRKAAVTTVGAAAVPVALVTVYFAATGAVGKFVEAALVFPLIGVRRPPETLGARIRRIVHVVNHGYQFSGLLIWAGLAALVLLAVVHLVLGRHQLAQAVRDPLVCVLLVTLLFEVGYAMYDFQGAADVYPILPYAALGLAGATATLVRLVTVPAGRYATTAAVLVAAAVLTGFSWSWFTNDPDNRGLRAELADACAVQRMISPAGGLYALGDPTPLAVMHRGNPDRFIYLGSGTDRWKVNHLRGGSAAWTAQIRAAHPAVIATTTWSSELARQMTRWLKRDGYHFAYAGQWRLLVNRAAIALAQSGDVMLTPGPTAFAMDANGQELPAAGCTSR